MKQLTISVADGGEMAFVYDDDLLELLDEGEATIARASHVEPAPHPDGGQGWNVDMSPSGGPASLGVYRERSVALAVEVAWLQENVL